MGSISKSAPRVLGIATAAALVISASACSSSKSSGSASGGKSGGSFTYWSMWRADEPQGKAIKAAAEQFTAATGVKVDLQFVGGVGRNPGGGLPRQAGAAAGDGEEVAAEVDGEVVRSRRGHRCRRLPFRGGGRSVQGVASLEADSARVDSRTTRRVASST